MLPKDSAIIQGSVDSELTPEFVLEVGKTLGTQYKHVTIGRNMNPSSMMILNSLIAGLTCTGADVRNAGVLPSPAITFASENTDCCIMIGNPDDSDRVSGLSLINVDGRYFNGPQIFTFKNRLSTEKVLPDYSSVGNIRPYNGAIDKYCKKAADYIGTADCQIVVDCASDCPSLAIPSIMKMIGADSMVVSCQTDINPRGTWANREEYNIKTLSRIVKANYGSIGVALNNDGTRIAAIDETGEQILGEDLIMLFTDFLEPRKIVVPVDTSMAVKEHFKGSIKMSKLGSESLGEAAKIAGAELGGTADGSFVFKSISYSTDGITAAGILAKIATETSIGDAIADYPRYYRDQDVVKYPANREIIAKKIAYKISTLEYEDLNVTDGWRVDMESGWFLIRFSDMENSIEIKAEGTDRIYTAGLMEIAKEVTSSSVKESL